MTNDILILLGGLVLLIAGGEFLVRGASSLAIKFHISPLVVGLTIVAFGTSAPELLISLNAALKGSSDLAMGNVVGSNICNIALILGLTAVLSPIPVGKDSIRIDWPVAMGSAVLLLLLILDGAITRVEGLVFVALLVAYNFFLIRNSRKLAKLAGLRDNDALKYPTKDYLKDGFFIALGGVGLYFGAEWFVEGARGLASGFGISERVIGLTVVALGTSLPELVTSVIAAIKKETDIAIGNIMGSNIFNILSILGITSIVKQINISREIIHVDMVWMLILTAILLPMMLTLRKITRLEGLILLGVYIYYIQNVMF